MAVITHVEPEQSYLADMEQDRWYDGLGLYLVLALIAGIVAVLA